MEEELIPQSSSHLRMCSVAHMCIHMHKMNKTDRRTSVIVGENCNVLKQRYRHGEVFFTAFPTASPFTVCDYYLLTTASLAHTSLRYSSPASGRQSECVLRPGVVICICNATQEAEAV